MQIIPKNKKAEGVVTNTVMGVGGLILAVIVTLILVSTVLNANLLIPDKITNIIYNGTTASVVNETGVFFGDYTQAQPTCTLSYVQYSVNATVISAGNYSVSNCFITYTGGGVDTYNNTKWNITSTTTYVLSTDANNTVSAMGSNLSLGIDKVSEKIPTILLIVAVVFLFGALVLLIRNSQAMGVGTGGSL